MKSPLRVTLAAAFLAAAMPAVARAQMVESMKFTTTFAFTAGMGRMSRELAGREGA